MAASRPLHVLLAKTSDWDKDERYMATNDLCTILSKDAKLTEDMEKQICVAVLKQLDDPSNDVQSVAVKCLAIILKKVKQNQIGEVATKLSTLIVEGKDALRDIYSIALKTLIVDVPDSMGVMVAELLTGKVLSGISRQGADNSDDIKKECLDNMTELLKRFGHLNERDHVDIMGVVMQQLDHSRAVIRKRSANCLGALAVVSSDMLLNQLVAALLDQIGASEKKSAVHTRTLIQTIGTVSRTVGYRLGRHLGRIVPLFLRFCGDAADESQYTDEANELRENCFPGLESFVRTCPKEVEEFLPQILTVAQSFMRFDPNYAYDDDADESGEGSMTMAGDSDNDAGYDEEEEEDYGADEFGGVSDDDDTSWKVRKVAIRVISAVISSRPDMHRSLVDRCGTPLLSRFKEREENVRVDIISCFTALIKRAYQKANVESGAASDTAAHMQLTRQISGGEDLIEVMIPRIVNECYKHLNQTGATSIRTKVAVFSLLRTLVVARRGGLDTYLSKLIQAAEKSLQEKNQSLKLDTLVFMRECLQYHPAIICQPLLSYIVPAMTMAVSDEWYKIIAEGLRVSSALVAILRPADAPSIELNQGLIDKYLDSVYNAIFSKLDVVDIDQEIKECSIAAAGVLISHLGNHPSLASKVTDVLAILHKRMENQTTRITTLKTLTQISSSSLVSLDLRSLFKVAGCEIAAFLRQTTQSSRLLKQSSLLALEALLQSPSTVTTAALAEGILKDMASVLVDTDMHLCQLGLKLAVCVLNSTSEPAGSVLQPFHVYTYPKLLVLARSSLLHGQTLQSLVVLFQSVLDSANSFPPLSFGSIFSDLYTEQRVDELQKLSISNLSRCIAAVCSGSTELYQGAALQFAKDVNANLNNGNQKALQLSLLCLGEVGQSFDLCSANSSGVGGADQWLACVLPCFDSTNEDTKMSAACALGHMTVGNMAAFLPTVLGSGEHYLLLASLKEVILVHANTGKDFSAYEAAVLPVLLKQYEAREDAAAVSASGAALSGEAADRANSLAESVRTMVAECLGALMTFSGAVIPLLLSLLKNSDSESHKATRHMIATTLRFAIVRRSGGSAGGGNVTAAMTSVGLNDVVIAQFLILLQDSDLDVKKAALMLVNTAVHHCPDLVIDQLREPILPVLLETLQLKLERTVDLGPFKHKVDDNLALRKVSLSCVETILDVCPQKIDVAAIMAVVPILLADKDEIKLQTHQIIAKLRLYSSGSVLAAIESLIDPLEKTIMKKPPKPVEDAGSAGTGSFGDAQKVGGGNPDTERALELVRSALRCALNLNRLDDMPVVSRKWLEFMERIQRVEHIAPIWNALQDERNFD